MTVPDRYIESDQTRNAREVVNAFTTAHFVRKYSGSVPGTPGPLIDHRHVEILDGDLQRLTGFDREDGLSP